MGRVKNAFHDEICARAERVERYSYKTALRAKGILPLPPYGELRTVYQGAHEILNPALAKSSTEGLQPPARGGEAPKEHSAT